MARNKIEVKRKDAIRMIGELIESGMGASEACKKFLETRCVMDVDGRELSFDGVRVMVRRARIKQSNGVFNVDGDQAIYEYSGQANITTLDEALEFSKVDLSVWEVERHTFNSYQTTMKVNDEPVARTNIQVKVWFKHKTIDHGAMMRELLDGIRSLKPAQAVGKYKSTNGVMLEIDIFDPHFGKLAWHMETGEDYDVEIAKKRYHGSVDKLLGRTVSAYDKIEKILYPIGNDFLHYDTLSSTTTAGTRQDTDTRWQKMWIEGRKVIMETVEKLRTIAPVEVVRVPSNHDFQSMFYMGDLLEVYYEKTKDVKINNLPTTRKYVRFGKCGIGFTHGDNEKHTDLPMIMLRENQREWSDVSFMEWHLGHFHKRKQINFLGTDEFHGISIKFLRSLSAPDAWHYLKGYVKGLKGCESFVWDKEEGLVGNFFENIK